MIEEKTFEEVEENIWIKNTLPDEDFKKYFSTLILCGVQEKYRIKKDLPGGLYDDIPRENTIVFDWRDIREHCLDKQLVKDYLEIEIKNLGNAIRSTKNKIISQFFRNEIGRFQTLIKNLGLEE